MMDTRTDKERVTAAFKALRKKGYIARQNFMCCMGCGLAAMPEGTKKWVFYHKQDTDRAFPQDTNRAFRSRTEYLDDSLMIRWGGDAQEIVAAFRAEGLNVEHNGSENTCIEITKEAVPEIDMSYVELAQR